MEKATQPSDLTLPCWFDGRSLFLNEVLGEEVDDPDDPRLYEDERENLLLANENAGHAVLELPTADPRSVVQGMANNSAIQLSTLNHDSCGLRSALLTSFDLVDDVAWLREELRLSKTTNMTFCMHPFKGKHDAERLKMIAEMQEEFDDVVIHFPGEQEFARASPHHVSGCRTVGNCSVIDFSSACSVHAKLLLLEFDDRLRIAVTSANLKRLHWSFRGEVVWVQDFPRVQTSQFNDDDKRSAYTHHDAARLFDAGPFARDLVHFVSDLLTNSQRERQNSWVTKLASFDLSGASVKLVLSLPGLFVPSRALKPHEFMLPLHAEALPGCGCCPLELKLGRTGRWELYSNDSEKPRLVGKLQATSASALNAATLLGLTINSEVEVLPTGTEEAKQMHCAWDRNEQSGDPNQSFLHEFQHSIRSVLREWWSVLFPPRETLVIRVCVSGSCIGRWTNNVADFASCMDVNYGFFSLREHLGTEVWLEGEESEYAAITGSISWPKDAWLQRLDYFVGRMPLTDFSGPQVVVPVESVPIEPAHVELDRRGQLCAHSAPWHAPGRELIYNHSKVLMRKFRDSHHGISYGWVYAGSHNLTKAAWGELCEEDQERLWVSNRELGVLFLQPRKATSVKSSVERAAHIFETLHLPFGFPLVPADIDGREVHEWADDEEEVVEGWWQSPDGVWTWRGGSWNGWQWDQDDESEDDWEPCQHADWRMRTSSWWWWTGN